MHLHLCHRVMHGSVESEWFRSSICRGILPPGGNHTLNFSLKAGALPGEVGAGSCINWYFGKFWCSVCGMIPSSHQPLRQYFFWAKVLEQTAWFQNGVLKVFLDWLTSCIGFHLWVLEPYFCGIGRDHTSVSCHCGLLVKANMVRGVIFSQSDGGWRGDTAGMTRIYSPWRRCKAFRPAGCLTESSRGAFDPAKNQTFDFLEVCTGAVCRPNADVVM